MSTHLRSQASVYVHFKLLCNNQTQWKLHKLFRRQLRKWKGLVERAVLTYHYNNPPAPDCLYVCLDIPSVKEPLERRVRLSDDVKKQIPRQIMESITVTCEDYGIEFHAIDYYHSLEVSKAPLAYENASIEEILRFASIGTEVAIEVLDRFEEDENAWRRDSDLAEFVIKRLKVKMNVESLKDYKWWYQALHFAANPLGVHQDQLIFPHLDDVIRSIKFILEEANR